MTISFPQDSKGVDNQVFDLFRRILETGIDSDDRTGVGTRSVFGHEMRFDLQEGLPLITTKKVFWKKAFIEALWMLSGDDNIQPLVKQGVNIWTDWPLQKYRDQLPDDHPDKNISRKDFSAKIVADNAFAKAHGCLNRVYGKQWREWKTPDGDVIDQVSDVIDMLKNNPGSRRILWEGWNVGELKGMALPPCHKTYQFYVNQKEGTLSSLLYQRSCDSFLGLAFNLVNQALFTHLLAAQTGYKPGEMIWYGGDVHLYSNHFEQVKLQMSRAPRIQPELVIKRHPDSLFDYTIDDLDVEGYDPHPYISGPVAV